jgi:hypothetical protein
VADPAGFFVFVAADDLVAFDGFPDLPTGFAALPVFPAALTVGFLETAFFGAAFFAGIFLDIGILRKSLASEDPNQLTKMTNRPAILNTARPGNIQPQKSRFCADELLDVKGLVLLSSESSL